MLNEILFEETALKIIEEQIQIYGSTETGGVLLGFIDKEIVVINKVTDPGPGAHHSEYYFRADNNYSEMLIDMEYANSGGKIQYIGEWHTHPQIKPIPSYVDFQSLKEIRASHSTEIVMVIFGSLMYNKNDLNSCCTAFTTIDEEQVSELKIKA